MRLGISRRVGVGTIIAALSATAFGAFPAAAAPPAAYVALGDSYVAVAQDSRLVGDPGCRVSRSSYPFLAAAQARTDALNASCWDARTDNIDRSQQKIPGGIHAVQLESLTPLTKAITVGVGGNDVGFASIIQTCALKVLFADRGGEPCTRDYASRSASEQPAAKAEIMRSSLVRVLSSVKAAAPRASVTLVGYPTVIPDQPHRPIGGCYSNIFWGGGNGLPFSTSDLPFLRTVQESLEKAMAAAAAQSGVTFLSRLAATAAHSPCAGAGETWIQPAVMDWGHLRVQPTSLHPNTRGVQQTAEAVAPIVRRAIAPMPKPTPTPTRSVTPTPTATVTPAPITTPTTTPTPTATPTPTGTPSPTGTPTPTGTPNTTPTPTLPPDGGTIVVKEPPAERPGDTVSIRLRGLHPNVAVTITGLPDGTRRVMTDKRGSVDVAFRPSRVPASVEILTAQDPSRATVTVDAQGTNFIGSIRIKSVDDRQTTGPELSW